MPPLGVFCPPLRGGYSPCPPNRGIPYNCLVLGLKCSGCSHMYQIVPLLLALFVYMYGLWLVLYLIILRVPQMMMPWEHPSDVIGVGIPSPTVISFGTDSNTPLFIWFNPYSETFSYSFIHVWVPIGWQVNFIHFKTIVAIAFNNL